MIRQKSLNIGWGTLTCSVQDCPKRPEIALEVDRRMYIGQQMGLEEGVMPVTAEYLKKGLPHSIAIYTPCPSDEGAVCEYLAGRGYTPDTITVIPKETIERYAREEAERESRRAGKERR